MIYLFFYKIFLCFFILNLPLTKLAMQDLWGTWLRRHQQYKAKTKQFEYFKSALHGYNTRKGNNSK